FHAKDGIRVFHVTGVQTCALPISSPYGGTRPPAGDGLAVAAAAPRAHPPCAPIFTGRILAPACEPIPASARNRDTPMMLAGYARSEERRVGKECKSEVDTSNIQKI